MKTRVIFLAAFASLLVAGSADAQQRRSAGGGPPPEPREIIESRPRQPFVGSWMGSMKLSGDNLPVSVDINADGDAYKTTWYTPDGAKHPTAGTEMVNGMVRFKVPNNGGGVWIYEATKIQGDTILGKVRLADGPPGLPSDGTLTLIRMRR